MTDTLTALDEKLSKIAVCIYIAVEKSTADDIATTIHAYQVEVQQELAILRNVITVTQQVADQQIQEQRALFQNEHLIVQSLRGIKEHLEARVRELEAYNALRDENYYIEQRARVAAEARVTQLEGDVVRLNERWRETGR